MMLRRVRGRHYDEIFATTPLGSDATGDATGAATGGAAAFVVRLVEQEGLIPLRAVTMGGPTAEVSMPCPSVHIEPQHGQRCEPAAQLHGIALRDRSTARVASPSPDVRIVDTGEGDDLTRRFYQCIQRTEAAPFTRQAESVFARVEGALREHGLVPRQITRTWFFIGDIERNYAPFNEVRNAYFDRWGIDTFPASTGIGAGLGPENRLSAVIEATGGGPEAVAKPFNTVMQCPPVRYGPRFTRANTYQSNGCQHVNVSGISSIDQAGESLRSEDVDELVTFAMRSFSDLLERGNMRFDDLCSAYVFVKNAEARRAFDAYVRREGLDFPYLLNFVDICRPELMFEIDGKAVRPLDAAAGPRAPAPGTP